MIRDTVNGKLTDAMYYIARQLQDLVKHPHPRDLALRQICNYPQSMGKEIQSNALGMLGPPTLGFNMDWCIRRSFNNVQGITS